MLSPQAVIYFLLVWTVISVPLALLVGAMIRFGADGKLPFDQTGQELRTPSREMRRVPAAAEKQVAHLRPVSSR